MDRDDVSSNPVKCFPRNLRVLWYDTRPQTSGGKRGGSCKNPFVDPRSRGEGRAACLPDEAPGEYGFENFRRCVRGFVQQRVPGAFELDYVFLAPFDPPFQGSHRVDVSL